MLIGKHGLTAIIAAALLSLHSLAGAASTLDEANERTRKFIRETMEDKRIPGLQIAVIKDDRVVLSESHGLANVENRVPATSTTLFPINSATKSFTGVAMMQLAEAGLVDLSAPVSRYLGDLPEAWRSVRVRQLLAHTSGLPDILDQQGLLGGGSELDAWKAVKLRPMDAPIGERFAYNQTNYGLLAQIIVKQTKMPYERYLAKRQFDVAGMPLSTFGDSYDLVANAATMYSYLPRKTDAEGDDERLSHWFYDMPHGLWAGGGIQTTADEVARWIIALSSGQLISAANVQNMWMPEPLNSGAKGRWAAGWPVLGTSPNRQVAGMGGARAAFVIYPDDRLAIVVLTNLVGANPQDFIPKIAEFYKPMQLRRSP
ncbi:serine hydrolase domain-containing protein [Montanilutibacter psychrotolerans]|uniref:Class A beta-lactamase-related serine hydrolase n=1 Tax=Montanilutibacter psychrotolerans TaxID=1327343 RepID=A0A3M8SYJ4_9GAMM|nr:serine hydrolase domain-containing protein [Lysobacter psychrotolerans]RNF86488.1 class A beta-lactamase-related serine hydrolase [Lysobacter psychrotolerans]